VVSPGFHEAGVLEVGQPCPDFMFGRQAIIGNTLRKRGDGNETAARKVAQDIDDLAAEVAVAVLELRLVLGSVLGDERLGSTRRRASYFVT
jgi:hypothetical protein